MNSREGVQPLSWLLGDGEARGIALVFLISGLAIALAGGGLAFFDSIVPCAFRFVREILGSAVL